MIRTCMYCGRELAPEEVCHCPQSEQARKKKEQQHGQKDNARQDNHTWQSKQNTYTKGDTQPRPREKWTNKVKASWKRVTAKIQSRGVRKGNSFFRNLGTFFLNFFKNPIYAVSNPGTAGVGEVIILIAMQAVVLSLTTFFSYRSILHGISSVITSMLPGIGGTTSVAIVGGWNSIGLFFAVIAFVFLQFFLLSGLFFFITRVMMRKRQVGFWEIAIRFAISSVPITAMGLVCILFSFFSLGTVLVLLLAACVMSVLLGYEGLCAQWEISPDRVIYITILGYMIYWFLCQGFGRIFFEVFMK